MYNKIKSATKQILIIFSGIIATLFVVGCMPIITITLDADEGTINGESKCEITPTYGSVVDLTEYVAVLDGYNFLGWVTSNGEEVTSISATSSQTCFAIYEKIEEEVVYTIQFDYNGGTVEGDVKTEYKVGEEIILPVPTKPHKIFKGFSLNGEAFTSSTLTESVVLVAEWEDITHRITYILDGGEVNALDTFIEGEEFVLTDATKEGYKFLGWYTDQAFQTSIEVVTATTDITVYAKWEKTTVTINYILNGGLLDNPLTELELGTRYTLPVPTSPDMIFDGWYLDSTFQTLIEEITATTDITVYAKWKKTIVTINYVLNGGLLDNPLTELGVGTSYILPVPTSLDMVFLGWYLDSTFQTLIEEITATADIIVYAKWKTYQQIIDEYVPDVIVEDIELPSVIDVGTVKWATDSKRITSSGIIDQTHSDEAVHITALVKTKYKDIEITKTSTVKGVVFPVIDMPIASYVYCSNLSVAKKYSDEIFSPTAKETLNIVYYGFLTFDTKGNINKSSHFLSFYPEVYALRKQGIRVLLCVGGSATNFSLACQTTEGLEKLAKNLTDVMFEYNFDGIDIDWEYPGVSSSGLSTEVDRTNFIKLMQTLRMKMDARCSADSSKYLLTAAIPSSSWGHVRFGLGSINASVDYINMMSYDMNNTNITSHLVPLFASTNDNGYGFGVDKGISFFTTAGLDKKKIIIGAGFYGKSYLVTGDAKNPAKYPGLGAAGRITQIQHASGSVFYWYIRENLLTNPNYVRYYDNEAKVPYLYNKTENLFVTYEDEQSLTDKIKYAKREGVGLMFWDYGGDNSDTLIKAISQALK